MVALHDIIIVIHIKFAVEWRSTAHCKGFHQINQLEKSFATSFDWISAITFNILLSHSKTEIVNFCLHWQKTF